MPKTQNIKQWLDHATKKLLSIGITSASLDAQIILESSINKDRTFLHANPEMLLGDNQIALSDSYLKKRLDRVPIAYIVGKKEFYGREFIVNDSTLIPRPETEDIIESIKQSLVDTNRNTTLVDVGTGCGCIGITAKLEFEYIDVTLSDISADALQVAQKNALELSANVKIVQSDLLEKLNTPPDIIVANLPYVDKDWPTSPELKYEPEKALFAKDKGMFVIKKLIKKAKSAINNNGYLIIEADPLQHNDLILYAKDNNFALDHEGGYILSFKHQR